MLRFPRMGTELKRPEMQHSLVSCIFNHTRRIFKVGNAEHSVIVRRLLFGRNAKPFVIWIERYASRGPFKSSFRNP